MAARCYIDGMKSKGELVTAVFGFTIAEAAERLGLSVSTVRHQAQAGRLRASKVGRDWLVSEREIERYRAESLGKPGRTHR